MNFKVFTCSLVMLQTVSKALMRSSEGASRIMAPINFTPCIIVLPENQHSLLI